MERYDTNARLPTGDRVFVDAASQVVATRGQTLIAYGLGACVAVALYDDETGIGGMANAILPRVDDGASATRRKFVDASIEDLLRSMADVGAGYGSIRAWIVGGAQLFDLEALATDIGDRNVEAARETLDRLEVPVAAADVGGDRGRTAELEAETGAVRVRTLDDEVTSL